MNLQDLVCTFSQAKKLKELGVNEHAYFHWGYGSGPERIITLHSHAMCDDPRTASHFESVAAYTSQEVGEIISKEFKTFSQSILNTPFVNASFPIDGVHVPISVSQTLTTLGITKEGLNLFYYDTPEAQARAEFLIYLLENKQ